MRLIYLAAVCLLVLPVAAAIHGYAVDARAGDVVADTDIMRSATGIRGLPGLADPTLKSGSPAVPRKRPENMIRLAQSQQPLTTGNPSVAPFKWVGRLVTPAPTKQHPNEVSECTGQFIGPNIVLTAAHCLRDLPDNPTGPWYDLTKQTFTLQYQAGVGSQMFKTVCGATNPQWVFPPNYAQMTAPQKDAVIAQASQHDFAMLLVDGNSPTGAMPYQTDWKGKFNGAVKVGYAGNILDEEVVQESRGIVFFANDIPMFPQSLPNLVVQWQSATDFTNGSSGGAWVANFSNSEGANSNILIAVTSFGNDAYPGATFGAYLTAAEFNPLLNFVANGCK
jgi:hypothetical protein